MTSTIPFHSHKEGDLSGEKTISFLSRIPFHPFLFVIYPILFLVSHNGLSFWDGGPFLSAICLASALFLGVSLYFFLKNARHAGLILSFWIIVFFGVIPFCDFLRMTLLIMVGRSVPNFLLLVYSIGTFFLWRLKGDFQFTTRLLNTISFVLIVFSFVGMGFNALSMAKDDKAVSRLQNHEHIEIEKKMMLVNVLIFT